MAWPGDLLSRFRPAWVPVDRAAETAAELEPVLALLAEAESARLTGQAERRATDRRELAGQRLPGYVGRVVAMVRTAGEEAAATGQEDLR